MEWEFLIAPFPDHFLLVPFYINEDTVIMKLTFPHASVGVFGGCILSSSGM